MTHKRSHQLRRFRQTFIEAAWAIVPEVLEQLAEALWDPTQVTLLLSREDEDDEPDVGYQVVDGVGVISFSGPIIHKSDWISRLFGYVGTDAIEATLGKAVRDPKVSSIVMNIDSPGGSVLGTSQLGTAIFEARAQKPITAVANSMACSAAYWVGTAANQLYAAPGALVGSVGVYSVHREFSRALENIGIKSTVIKAGKLKATGNPYEPLSSESRAAMQGQVDAYYEQFVGALARNRGTTLDDVKDNYGQGMSLVAEQAASKGMIDGVRTLRAVVEAARAAVPRTPPAAAGVSTTPKKGVRSMDPRLKAQMVAAGLIEADATDETAQAALRIFYAAHGKPAPAAVAEQIADVAAVLAPKAPVVAAPAAPVPAQPAVPAKVAGDQDTLAERNRVLEIKARGALLGVSAVDVDKAIEDGTSVDAFLRKSTDTLAANRNPVGPKVDGSASENFETQALEAQLARAYPQAATDQKHPLHGMVSKIDRRQNHLVGKSLMDLAGESLRIAGCRLDGLAPAQVAEQALASGPTSIYFGGGIQALGGSSQVSAPGSFPNLLSALVGKMMDVSLEFAPTTYQRWATQIASVPDFKPKTIVAIGEFGELPEHEDGKDFEGSKPAEEVSWIQSKSYGSEWALTPKMVVDDDLNALIEAGQDFTIAHECTLNRLCISLLTANAALVDGVALFHATHANLVDSGSGGTVSTTQLDKMRLKFRQQSGISAKRKLNLNTNLILVPPTLETAADQTLGQQMILPVPATDSNTNIYRGRVDYAVDVMLEDYTLGTSQWYAFADPRIARAIIYCYQQGYERMQRRLYFNPKNNCRILQVEGRMAAAVRQWRGVVKNYGA
jgi:signal peptide peptidase SppA